MVPQARIRRTFELADVDVQGDAAKFPLSQSLQQGFFVDDLPARDVDQDRSRFHRCKSRSAYQMGRLFRPRAANGYELAFGEQVMQEVGGLQSCEARRKWRPRSHVPARADHAHTRCRTKVCCLLANASCADNAGRLVPDYYGIVSPVIETVAPLIPKAQVKATSEMKKACQHILGQGSPIREPARGRHDNVGAPKIGVQKIARASRKLMDPFQPRRACLKSFSGGQPVSTICAKPRAWSRSSRLIA